MRYPNLTVISAGAGSGKTYSLTQQMADLLNPSKGTETVRASGLIATTFTKKAAAELKERVRIKLLEENLSKEADELGNAMIGTVHSIGVKLLKRFAFEAGISPDATVMAEDEGNSLFEQTLSRSLTPERIEKMEHLAKKFQFNNDNKDWKSEIKHIISIARTNNMDGAILNKSKAYSIESFFKLLDIAPKQHSDFSEEETAEALYKELKTILETTIVALQNNEADTTKKTGGVIANLKEILNKIQYADYLDWPTWAKLSKVNTAKKSVSLVEDLSNFASKHYQYQPFQNDIKQFIGQLFDIASDIMDQYQTAKANRGLLDFVDMEVLILKLLQQQTVLDVLKDELDLLLVDEFQDTNPIQLQIFLKLTQIAKKAIWVGDPKQSIYGFRGAAPELMTEVTQAAGKNFSLKNSWRSTQDLVYAVNHIFTEAFTDMPKEQIALEMPPNYQANEKLGTKLQNWHFESEVKSSPAKWMMNCIADRVRLTLETPPYIRVKGKSDVRKIRPGDIAILCRTNGNCIEMAKALNNAGLNVSIARNGLLSCAESKLITASLRYLLNKHDNLAQAEIKHLVSEQELEHLIVDFLSKEKEEVLPSGILQSLALIRKKITELSPSEILDLLIETLDIRRITARWDNHIQRHANIDQLRFLTAEYENNCNNSYSAATLSGLLVWFNNLAKNTKDTQGNSSNTNAVQVLTYHRSKGLEWPFVICYDLEKKARETIWGLRLIRTVEQIDLNAPLENQLICYWVNPYDKQSKNTVLNNAIKDSETLAVQQLKELQEETRLLYVGLTRARDYLVFPTRSGKPTRWLNRCYTQGDESHPVLQLAHEAELWNWTNAAENRVSLTLDKSSTAYPTTFEKVEKTQSDILYIQPAQGPKDHTPTGIQAVEMASKKYKLKLVEIAQAPYSLPLEKDSAALHLPKILHQSIISMHKYPVTTQLQKITTMLEHHNLLEDYSAQQVMRQKDNFLALLKQLNPTNTVFNQPQRLFEENINIDLLLEGEQENYIFLVSDEENGTRLSSKQSTQLHKINALIQKDFPSTTLIFGVPTASKLYRVEFTLRS